MRIAIFLAIAAVLVLIAARVAVFLLSLLIYGVAIVCVIIAIVYAMRYFGGNRPGR